MSREYCVDYMVNWLFVHRKQYSRGDWSKTLAELGLTPSAVGFALSGVVFIRTGGLLKRWAGADGFCCVYDMNIEIGLERFVVELGN